MKSFYSCYKSNFLKVQQLVSQNKNKSMKISYKILILSLLYYNIDLYSQNKNALLIPYLVNGKYGFANEKVEPIIKAKYSFALPFFADNELSSVIKNKKPYIINRDAQIVIKNASSDFFKSSRITGMNIMPYSSTETIAIDKYCNSKTNDAFFLISAPDKFMLFDKINNLYIVRKNSKVFLVDTKAKIHSKLYDQILHINNNLIEYCITRDFTNNKFGLLNSKAKEVVSCMYDEIVMQSNGQFQLSLSGTQREFRIETKNYKPVDLSENITRNYKIRVKNRKRGIVDKSGNIVVEYKYYRLYYLNDNKFVFEKNNSAGIMDINEKLYYVQIAHNPDKKHKTYVKLNQNFVFFYDKDKWKLIDLNGKQTTNSYDGIFFDFQNVMSGATGVVSGNKLGVINNKGKLIIETKCDTIYGLRENASFVIKENGKWNWLDNKGEYIYKNFDNFNYLMKNYLLVFKNGIWFYVNDKGVEFQKDRNKTQ